MRMKPLTIALVAPLLMAAMPAQAYIGPGAGAGAIAVVVGIIASVVMAFFAIIWYPIKRLRRKRKIAKQTDTDASEGPTRS